MCNQTQVNSARQSGDMQQGSAEGLGSKVRTEKNQVVIIFICINTHQPLYWVHVSRAGLDCFFSPELPQFFKLRFNRMLETSLIDFGDIIVSQSCTKLAALNYS